MDHSPPGKLGITSHDGRMFAAEERHFAQSIDFDEPSPEPIVDIVVVVRDGIGEIRKLRLETRLSATQESLAQLAELSRVVERTMLEDALARFVSEIEAGKIRVALLE